MSCLVQLLLTFGALCVLLMYGMQGVVGEREAKKHGRDALAAEAQACAARGGNTKACKRAAVATCIENTPFTRISLNDCYQLAGLPRRPAPISNQDR